jgi:hypothetical protein
MRLAVDAAPNAVTGTRNKDPASSLRLGDVLCTNTTVPGGASFGAMVTSPLPTPRSALAAPSSTTVSAAVLYTTTLLPPLTFSLWRQQRHPGMQ